MTDRTNVSTEEAPRPPHAVTAAEGRGVPGRLWSHRIVGLTALIWSAFHLSLASFLILDSVAVRALHLGFALVITFLAYPMVKRPGRGILSKLSSPDRMRPFDLFVAVIAFVSAIYIVLDYEGLSVRQGDPAARDILVGILLLAVLLEAARRVVGPALPVISIVFLLYALYGNHLPDFLAFRGVSLDRLIGQMTMSTEGVYGIPLDVSANVVFLFVLFGAMLEKAGAGRYFIRLALSLLGRFRGGPAKAAVLGSGLTGMVSGSSIANVVTTGTFTIPLMKKVGYPPKKAAAVEVAASTDGQLMPPVMGAAAFIIAEYVNVSYLAVIKAAFIPAVVSYMALLYITHVEACKLGIEGMAREDVPRFREVFPTGVQFLIPIAVLLVELIYFRHSPQMSVFRAIVALVLVMLIQCPLESVRSGGSVISGIKRVMEVLVESMIAGGRNMVAVAVATACAGIIVGTVTLGLGGLVTEIIDQLSFGNLYAMLLITALACLVIGMGLPTTATYIVMASLTAPALVSLGEASGLVVPLIAAHLFCFYFGILADDTPPVGLAAYAAAAIAQSDPIPTGIQSFLYDLRTAILPFMFIFNHELLLIGVTGVFQGALILAASIIGAWAFVSATQGWFVTANRWYEIPFFLAVTLLMLRPDSLEWWLGLPHRYYSYVFGAALYGVLYWRQRSRSGQARHA
ncbi:MAG: TRAP transporter permease [Desulfomonilaceae bacterium]|nr:TRAP transporter permease [Desulfomonilaceae bacterium]